MNHSRSAARILAVMAVAGSLGACISLLPKQKPVQLYRFGFAAGPAPARAGPPGFTVQEAPTSFERAAAGDTILTVTGDEAAYISDARWVTSAATLFDGAVTRAFDAAGGPARLLTRGEPVRPDYALKLDVREFETRYDHGGQAPPTVVVELYAALIDRSADEPAAAKAMIFQASAPATENRAGAIARAYDVAVDRVLTDMVAWVQTKGG